MTLKGTIAEMQAGTSAWLAVDVPLLDGSLFFSQYLGLMTLNTSMSMRPEVHESQEHADPCRICSLTAGFLDTRKLFSSCLQPASWVGAGRAVLAQLVLSSTSRVLPESEKLSWRHQHVADETGRQN